MRAGVFFCAVMVLCVACTGSSKPGNQPLERMVFDSSPDMLGPKAVLGDSLSFHPPVDWNPLTEEFLDAMQASLPTDQVLRQRVERAFADSAMTSLLVVTVLDKADGVIEPVYQLLEEGLPDEVKRAEYLLNEFHCRQYLVQQPGRVQFRLLLEDRLLLDYFVPLQEYEFILELLEASIGSIHLSH